MDYLVIDRYKKSKDRKRYSIVDLSKLKIKNNIESILSFTMQFENEKDFRYYLINNNLINDEDFRYSFTICYEGRKDKELIPRSNAKPGIDKILYKNDYNIIENNALLNLLMKSVIPSNEYGDNYKSNLNDLKKIYEIAKKFRNEYNKSLENALNELTYYISCIENNDYHTTNMFYKTMFHLYHSLCCNTKFKSSDEQLVKEYLKSFPNQSIKIDNQIYPLSKTKAYEFGIEYITYLKNKEYEYTEISLFDPKTRKKEN